MKTVLGLMVALLLTGCATYGPGAFQTPVPPYCLVTTDARYQSLECRRARGEPTPSVGFWEGLGAVFMGVLEGAPTNWP